MYQTGDNIAVAEGIFHGLVASMSSKDKLAASVSIVLHKLTCNCGWLRSKRSPSPFIAQSRPH